MFSGYKTNKLRVNLKLSINRLKLLEKKKTELALKARKEIAEYIAAGKDDRAKIRVEHIIREDYLVEAMEMVELFSDLLMARMGLIESVKTCDEGLLEAVTSLIWVAPRLHADIPELKVVSDQLVGRYGKEFGKMARTNMGNHVNEKLMLRLSPETLPKILVEKYMIEIARVYNVPYQPDPTVMADGAIGNLIDMGPPPEAMKSSDIFGSQSDNMFYPTLQSAPLWGGVPPAPVVGPYPGMPHCPGSGSGSLPYPPGPTHPNTSGGHLDGAYPGSVAAYQPAPGHPDYVAPPLPEKGPAGSSSLTEDIPSYEEAVNDTQHHPSVPPRPSGYHNPAAGNLPYPSSDGVPPAFPPVDNASGRSSGYSNLQEDDIVLPDLPSVPVDIPKVPRGNDIPPGNDTGSSLNVDFDDLTRRFEELKRKK